MTAVRPTNMGLIPERCKKLGQTPSWVGPPKHEKIQTIYEIAFFRIVLVFSQKIYEIEFFGIVLVFWGPNSGRFWGVFSFCLFSGIQGFLCYVPGRRDGESLCEIA